MLVSLLFCLALADPNCVQADFTASMPPMSLPGPIRGAVIPPIRNPPVWTIPAGPVRFGGHWCDAEGDPMGAIEILDSTCQATEATFDLASRAWTVTCLAGPGVHVVNLKVTDAPDPATFRKPASRTVTLVFEAIAGSNTAPVLY
jgi:hypothetical protein